jgi:hypothetical protein
LGDDDPGFAGIRTVAVTSEPSASRGTLDAGMLPASQRRANETAFLAKPAWDRRCPIGNFASQLIAGISERPSQALARTPRPDNATLLALLAEWAPDPAVMRKILVDNPAFLYGFN